MKFVRDNPTSAAGSHEKVICAHSSRTNQIFIHTIEKARSIAFPYEATRGPHPEVGAAAGPRASGSSWHRGRYSRSFPSRMCLDVHKLLYIKWSPASCCSGLILHVKGWGHARCHPGQTCRVVSLCQKLPSLVRGWVSAEGK